MLEARCVRCDFTIAADDAPLDGCPRCRDSGVGANLALAVPTAPGLPLTVEEFYASQAPGHANGAAEEDSGIWRFAPRLPGALPADRVTLGEGRTPLIDLVRLADRPPEVKLLAKDESRNPTLSHKDRFMAAAMSRARTVGAEVVIAGTSGNGGVAAAAYAARAGLRCLVVTTPNMPEPPRRYIEALGACLVAVAESQDRWTLTGAAAREWGWYPLTSHSIPTSGSNLFGIAGYKTIAYEIALEIDPLPDSVAVPLAHGDVLSGIWQGFEELVALGKTATVPRMIAVAPAEQPSVAYNLGMGEHSPQARAAVEASGGEFLATPEDEILPLKDRLAREAGLFAEASSVLSVWGAAKAAAAGDTTVALLTSSGLKDPLPGSAPSPPLRVIEPSVEALREALPAGFAR